MPSSSIRTAPFFFDPFNILQQVSQEKTPQASLEFRDYRISIFADAILPLRGKLCQLSANIRTFPPQPHITNLSDNFVHLTRCKSMELYHITLEIKSTIKLTVPIDLLQLKYFYSSLLHVIIKYYIKLRCMNKGVWVKAFARLLQIKLFQINWKECRVLSILLSFS